MKNNIKVATIISYITLITGNIVSLIYTPFMLATLGTAEYGLFTLVNTIIAYIYLLDMGFGNAIIRYNSKYMAEGNQDGVEKINGMFLLLYSLIAVIGLVVGAILYFNLEKIFLGGLSLLEIELVKDMFIVALINLMFSFPLNVFNGIIMANERFTYVKMLAFIRTILNPVIMISILILGHRSLGMIIASTIFNISLGLINIIYCFIVLKIKIRFDGFDKKICYEIFKYSFFIFLSAVAYRIYWSTDQFVLGKFVGASSIAIYSIGAQFNDYFTSFSNVTSSMFLPKLTKLIVVEKNKEALMNILIKVSRIQFYIATFILIGFILVGKQFIFRWAGIEYGMSYYIAILVMMPQLVSILQTLFATMLEAMNKHKVKSIIYLCVAIFNLIITIYLVQILGVIGSAIGTAIGMIINAVLNNLYYKYKLDLDMGRYWKEIIKLIPPILLTSIIGYFITIVINPYSYLSIALVGFLFMVVYFAVCWMLAFNEYEKNIISSIFTRIKIVTQKYSKKF